MIVLSAYKWLLGVNVYNCIAAGRRDSMGRVMERARVEGGSRWTKKLLSEEAKNPDR